MSVNPGQNPFKGLYYYEEADKDIFYGRDKESEELCGLVGLNRLTVVFGKSGIGKTSLLNAGLFPLLRDKNFLPVRITLDYRKGGAPLLSQVKQAIRKELEIHGVVEMKKGEDAPADSIREDESLWEYFHRVDHLNKSFCGGKGGDFLEKSPLSIVTPVLVFDQFEEFFTIGKNHPQRELLVEELYWLVEEQVPAAVKERILKQKGAVPYLRGGSMVRVALGLREDYLPHLNGLKQRIPSIHRVLFRVIHFNGFQAREVMERTGAFADEAIKKDILDQFYPADMERGDVSVDKLEVEPALFSLLCYRVYEKGVGSLTRQTRDDILAGFYDQVLGQLPRGGELAEWIELHLLTEGGFRTPFYLERGHGMRDIIEAAIDKKLLRKLYIGEKEHVEVIHDVLAPVINKRRNRRMEEKKRLEMEKEWRRKRIITGIISGIAILAIFLAIYAFIQKNRADKQTQEALKQKDIATQNEQRAFEEKKRADELYIEIVNQIGITAEKNKEVIEYYKEALCNRLASKVESLLLKNNYKAIRIAEAAYKIGLPSPPVAVVQALCSASYSTWKRPFYTTELKHNGIVQTVTFSPDGSKILTASEDYTPKLWDIEGNILAELKGHTGPVTCAVFSPEGLRILTASKDNTAKLWNIDGKILADLKGHTKDVSSAVFSPDGSRILTASDDKTAKLWNINGGILADLKGHTDSVNSVMFSPNGEKIITAAADGTAKFWDLEGKLLGNIKVSESRVISAIFSPDDNKFLTTSFDKTTKLWDLNGNLLAELKGHTYNVNTAVFSHNGSRILTASDDDTAKLWDLNGKLLADLKGHTDKVNSAEFSPDDSRILTASYDNTAKLWDTEGNILEELKGHSNIVSSAIFSTDGVRILTASYDNTAKLWDENGRLPVEMKGHTERLTSAVFSSDGTRILTASEDHTAKLWDIKGKLLADSKKYTGDIISGVFFPDGPRVLTDSRDNTVKLWDMERNLLAELKGHTDYVNSAVLSMDGTWILTASNDSTVKLWGIKGNILLDLKGHTDKVNSAVFSPDGSRILTASDDYTAKLWDIKGNIQVDLKGHTDNVNSAVLSPTDPRILTASDDNTAKLWDLEGKILLDLKWDKYPITSAVFSPDGLTILTASKNNIAKLWDLKGNLLADLNGHADTVKSAMFSPDGKRIVTASYDGTAIIWPTPETIMDYLKTAPIPKLSEEEKKELGIEGFKIE